MKVAVIGLGYIGLPTAIMFARYGARVIGIDVSEQVIASLAAGKPHIEEPNLAEYLRSVTISRQLTIAQSPEKADVFIIAVPTPNNDDEYSSCDVSAVVSAVNSILPVLEAGNTIIIESTVAPRTTEDVIASLLAEKGFKVGENIYLAHCPERVLPGKIFHELAYNNRLIGGVTPACSHKAKTVYQLFVKGELIETSASEAELSKLMENTYRDVNIALANELVKVGKELNIDALNVISLANKHPRVNIHSPGPGVGGHCLAVDPYFIIAKSPAQTPLIQAARKINRSMPELVFEAVRELLQVIEGVRVTVFGLAYKGNIDDTRESPALSIVRQLQKLPRITVVLHDPHVHWETIEPDSISALRGSDLLLILCDHDEFKLISEEHLSVMKQRVVFDTKNIIQNQLSDARVIHMGNIGRIDALG